MGLNDEKGKTGRKNEGHERILPYHSADIIVDYLDFDLSYTDDVDGGVILRCTGQIRCQMVYFML